MKKYFFGLAAIVAIVLFSAFNGSNSSKPTLDQEYIFYQVDGNGEIDLNSPLNEELWTEADFNSNLPGFCHGPNEVDCVRGFLETSSPTETSTGDITFMKGIEE